MGLRLRLGRWLLRSEAEKIERRYFAIADGLHRAGDHETEKKYTYLAIGARYVGTGYPPNLDNPLDPQID